MRPNLYQHQRNIVTWAGDRDYSAIFAEMGTGKALMAIELLEKWGKRAVYVCKSALTGTAANEFALWSSPLRVVRFEGGTSAAKRLAIINGEWDVLVANVESMRNFADVIARLVDVVVIDEAQIVKNRRAQQTQATRRLTDAVKKKHGNIVIMTGSPITRSILDLWSECDVLWPSGSSSSHLLGAGNYQSFEHTVAIVTPHPKIRGVKLYRYIPEATARITDRMAEFSRVVMLRDVVDLPTHVFKVVNIDMEAGQRRIYDALKRDLIATIDGAELDTHSATVLSSEGIASFTDESLVATPHLTTLMLRLQQITSGHVKTLDGEIKGLPNAKLNWLRENLDNLTGTDGDHKVVIFCRFIRDVDDIEHLCREAGVGVVRIDGSTSKKAAENAEQFQSDPGVRVLVGNVSVAGTGFTLTAADYCIFYSHSFSYGDRVQALKRVDRIGQRRSVIYYDLVCSRSIEDATIMPNLLGKQDVAVRTVAQLKEAIGG